MPAKRPGTSRRPRARGELCAWFRVSRPPVCSARPRWAAGLSTALSSPARRSPCRTRSRDPVRFFTTTSGTRVHTVLRTMLAAARVVRRMTRYATRTCQQKYLFYAPRCLAPLSLCTTRESRDWPTGGSNKLGDRGPRPSPPDPLRRRHDLS
jgi:hypothetical protein